jgi:GT2 family glycosyltransferase
MEQPKVSILILNWNGWEDTIECLDSLYKIAYDNYDVIIVDNASEDNSIQKIKEYAQSKAKLGISNGDSSYKQLRILECSEDDYKQENGLELLRDRSSQKIVILKNKANYGFAGGNNKGIDFALRILRPDYILLLNNDTIVDKQFLSELIKTANLDSNIGVIGPKIYFYDKRDLIQSVGFKIRWLSGECVSLGYKELEQNQYIENIEVDSLSGCAMIINKDIFDRNIFLDSQYFLYYEDTDFCTRVRRAGYKVICVPNSRIWHKNSISSKRIIGTREYYSAKNLFIFMKKYSKKNTFVIFLFYYFLFRFWFTLAVILISHKDWNAVKPFLRGVFNGLRNII